MEEKREFAHCLMVMKLKYERTSLKKDDIHTKLKDSDLRLLNCVHVIPYSTHQWHQASMTSGVEMGIFSVRYQWAIY